MNQIEALVAAYARFVQLPWSHTVTRLERIWFALYDPDQERRLRLHIGDFEIATRQAGHGWVQVDITDAFARWMAQLRYRDAYFEDPETLLELPDFTQAVANEIIAGLTQGAESNEETVVAVIGSASLFGVAFASEVFNLVAPHIQGRLLVFFPGQRDGSHYRLLDARDGWNYMAIPISATER